MKKMIKLLTLGATVAMLALPVAARSLAAVTETSAQAQCTQENKDAFYAAFRESRTADQPKAYDNAKKYLACPAGEANETTTKIIEYLKKWVGAYEDLTEKQTFRTKLYNEPRNYLEAYPLGAKILTREPENLKVLIDLGANGYLLASLKNPSLNAQAVDSAKKALALLDAGKTIDDWQPLSGKDEATAYLNYTIGVFTLEPDPATALKNLIKAAQFETPLKKSPFTYAYIGGAYEAGPYAKLSEAYKQYTGKDETPESKLALANINQIVDRMIDAYARAVALATDPKFAEQKKVWSTSLGDWYKYRHTNDTGMNEMVAGILSKPLPPEPTPLTSLPTAAPAATPTGNSGTTSTNGTTTSSTTAPATAQTTAPNGTAPKTTGAKPATPAGPKKPKNHHR
jgi:hypothetical protein